jgi:modification methylase
METHEVANIFPSMSDDEYRELKEDIKKNGLIEPIWTYRGKIIDGRHRYRACADTNTPAKFREYEGTDPMAFVLGLNLKRRHLTLDQLATVALEVEVYYAKEAKEKQSLAGTKHIGNQYTREKMELKEKIPDVPKSKPAPQARDKAAETVGVNSRYIQDAKRVEKSMPELIPRIKSGEISLKVAVNQVKDKEFIEKKPKPINAPEQAHMPKLYLGKCEHLDCLSDESIDLIITSPPYNLGSAYWPMGGNGTMPRECGIGYSDDMPEEVYQKWQIECFKELYRVAKPGASFFYNHKVRQVDGAIIHPMDWIRNKDNPWTLRQEIIWDRKSTHNHCPTLFWPIDERIYWMTKGKPILPDRPIRQASVWSFNGPTSGKWHPAPFTDELPTMLIEAVGRPGIVVLDPFGGSMTTCRTAQKFGYDSIGIDVNKEYIEKTVAENGWTQT